MLLATALFLPLLQIPSGEELDLEGWFGGFVGWIEPDSYGPGELRGRIVDVNGAGLPGIVVTASVYGLVDPESLGPYPLDKFERSGRTDRAGRYRIDGLPEGTFWLEAEALTDLRRSGRLSDTPASTSGEELLVVSKSQVLILHAVGIDPGPLPQASGFRAEWPREHGARAWILEREAPGGPIRRLEELKGSLLADSATFVLPPGEGGPVFAVASGGRFPARSLDADPWTGLLLRELEPVEGAAPGRLRVRATAGGESLNICNHVLTLEVPDAPLTLARAPGLLRSSGTTEIELPPGRYRVVVEGTFENCDCFIGIDSPRLLGRAEAIVDVRSGAATDCPLHLEPGGWLDIECSGTLHGVRYEPEAGELVRSPYGSEAREKERETRELRQLEIKLLHPERAPLTVLRTTEEPYIQGQDLLLRRPSWVGAKHASEQVPAGDYLAVVRLPDGQECRCDVRVHAGAGTPLIVDFDAP